MSKIDNATVTELKIDLVNPDPARQTRDSLRPDVVDDYAAILDELPPIVVFHDGKVYWLGDGAHRLAAAHKVGAEKIRAWLARGTYEDALRYALDANAKHGLNRSQADKRKSVALALAHFPKLSDRNIANLCRVDPHTVGTMRAALDKIQSGVVESGEFHTGQEGPISKSPEITANGNVAAEALASGSISPAAAEAIISLPAEEQEAAVEGAKRAGGRKPKPDREPGDDSDLDEKAKSDKSKNGKTKFDDREVDKAFGKLARLLNDRAKALGHEKMHLWKIVHGYLNDTLASWKDWQKFAAIKPAAGEAGGGA